MLVTITTSLMLCQHNVSLEGDCREILKVEYVHVNSKQNDNELFFSILARIVSNCCR